MSIRPAITTASAASDLASRAFPFVLSLIAGSTDIIGLLGLNGLFTAHITGNLVVLAAHIVAGDPTIFSYVLSVPVFMLMLFLTRLLAGGLKQIGVSTLRPLLLLQLFFLVAFLSVCIAAGPGGAAQVLISGTPGMFGVARMAGSDAPVPTLLSDTPHTALLTQNVTQFLQCT